MKLQKSDIDPEKVKKAFYERWPQIKEDLQALLLIARKRWHKFFINQVIQFGDFIYEQRKT
jgi:hypothetical protein